MPTDSIHPPFTNALRKAFDALGGAASANQLRDACGVSQPTISRWLKGARNEIVRMGRGRAARYGRLRELRELGGRHPTWRIDEEGRPTAFGTLHLLGNGGHWLSRPEVEEEGSLFEGLPPFVADMAPQGFLGRMFTSRHGDLGLPERTNDWSGDHMLVALLRRGEDCPGDLVLGSESMDRWLSSALEPVTSADYPELARRAASGEAGSSAGGEQPKFAAWCEGHHVLVKYVGEDSGEAAERWRDLLVCEAMALEHLHAMAVPAARARLIAQGAFRFMEVERFDRVGPRGRRGVVSLAAADNEWTGVGGNWSRVAAALQGQGRLSAEDARQVRWLDVFGSLIGNTDRHGGNLSFFTAHDGRLALAPVYDMLPMAFAPRATQVVDRPWSPPPPTAETLDVWRSAADAALGYWARVLEAPHLSAGFRSRAESCATSLEELSARVPV